MFDIFNAEIAEPDYRTRPQGVRGMHTESVGLQGYKFFRDLTKATGDVRAAMRNGSISPADNAVLAFEETILKHKGILVSLVTNEALAAVMPMYANENHALLNKFWHGFDIHDRYMKQWLKDSADKKGWVDDVEGKVGGFYSTYEHTMYMNFGLLFDVLKLSDEEVAAIATHEAGHAYTYIKFQHLTTTTNHVLQRISEEVMEKDPGNAVPYVLREMQKLNKDVTGKEVEALLKGDRSVLVGQLTTLAYGGVVSQLPTSRYDDTSSEQLADSFAVRHGAAKPLAVALYKINQFVGTPEVNNASRFVFRTMEITYTAMLLVAMPVASIPLGLFGAFMFTLTCWAANTANRDMTYDELRDRVQRMRNEMVTYLKRSDLDDAVQKTVLGQIDSVDAILDGIKPYKQLYQYVGDFFSPRSWAAKRTINYQRGLEDIASSDLFVMAARLNSTGDKA